MKRIWAYILILALPLIWLTVHPARFQAIRKKIAKYATFLKTVEEMDKEA